MNLCCKSSGDLIPIGWDCCFKCRCCISKLELRQKGRLILCISANICRIYFDISKLHWTYYGSVCQQLSLTCILGSTLLQIKEIRCLFCINMNVVCWYTLLLHLYTLYVYLSKTPCIYTFILKYIFSFCFHILWSEKAHYALWCRKIKI